MSLKNVIVFGDSYSTFDGYIPEGYPTFYCERDMPETDVRKVSEMWWHQVITETNSNLVLNDSWSGSTICYTGYNNVDCSKSSSFIYRFEKMFEENFFVDNEVNTVFVFGGTNDSWSGAPIGELKYDNFDKQDLYSVLPAVSYFMKTLKEKLPEAKIVWLINTELKPEISEGMKAACEYHGVVAVEFDYIDKLSGHPSVQGMTEIKNQILSTLKL